ncbi:MAG: exodeoxyribonuclease V subunit gamma [Propioniciclava sp.]|uniref:exodeoxyribonuclease V subunit gamma n=1 Tax=Propioniciclava sp. TaxID=2038686 RepID=UPI0039E223E9
MNEIHLHTSAGLDALAAAFTAHVAVAGDPFARPLVLVPGAGVQRWLSQQAARGSASDGEGITAGWDVQRLTALEHLLGGRSADDPWQPQRLVWSILAAVDAHAAGLEPLASHLAANDQRYANALRIARLFGRYADHRPAMLAGWLADPDAAASALGFEGWQVRLWVALHTLIAAPDPTQARPALAQALASGERTVPWPEVHVFAPRHSTPAQRGLLAALAARVPVHVWLPTCGPDDTRNALAVALGRRARTWHREWSQLATYLTEHETGFPATSSSVAGGSTSGSGGTALSRLQASIHTGEPAPDVLADGSLTIHSSHGDARQVEVLREVLTGLFADDEALEPREVVIACPDPAALAPHLAAAFAAPMSGVRYRAPHPATQLRVQLVEADASGANQVFVLVRDLMSLGTGRATVADLLALASHPFVARQFGFDADDLARLEDLITAAGVRWGIGREHRSWFGLGDIAQNTWQIGVQRLVMGEAFSADELVSAGVVSTVDDVSSTDTVLVGALAELVSRTSRLVHALGQPATVTDWVARLRQVAEQLADVPFDQNWQLSQFWSVLAGIETRAGTSSATLAPADALALLSDHFADRGTRPAYGNGSLVVCSLDALAQVPHRVVCLVGLDDRTFPRRGLGDGDDLLVRFPEPGDPDPGADDRQMLLDAVLAASERLVVVYQGQSTLSPGPHFPPAGLQDLIEAAGPDAHHKATLQPFDPANFLPAGGHGTVRSAPGDATQPSSFDAAALAGARALLAPRRPAPDRYAVGHLHRSAPVEVLDVERLVAFLQHPGKFLLKERADLTIGDDEPLEESLPLELNSLDSWKIGDAMLAALRAGHPIDAVQTDQWLSGNLPPRRLGAAALAPLAARAQTVHAAFTRAAGDASPEVTVIDLDIDGVRLTGRLLTRAGQVAESHYGRVQARHLAAAWVRQLALTVQRGRRTDAVLVGDKGTRRLSAPPEELARQFLADLITLASHGTEQVLPLPPRVAQYWAEQRHRGADPRADAAWLGKLWRWERDAVWKLWYSDGRNPPWTAGRKGDDPWGMPQEDTVLGALAMRVWEPIRRAAQ